jgi:hypothetical protein
LQAAFSGLLLEILAGGMELEKLYHFLKNFSIGAKITAPQRSREEALGGVRSALN